MKIRTAKMVGRVIASHISGKVEDSTFLAARPRNGYYGDVSIEVLPSKGGYHIVWFEDQAGPGVLLWNNRKVFQCRKGTGPDQDFDGVPVRKAYSKFRSVDRKAIRKGWQRGSMNGTPCWINW
jgi:hypothetical protein